MGFTFLHKHILIEQGVMFPISDIYRFENIDKVCDIYFDCTSLLYNVSYSLPRQTIINEPMVLVEILKKNIVQYVEIFKKCQENLSPNINVHLFFDGKSPHQKKILQSNRDQSSSRYVKKVEEENRPILGLSTVESRAERSNLVLNVAEEIENQLSLDNINVCCVSTPDKQEGESDIKIVREIILRTPNHPAIVTCDTDILISLEQFRRLPNNVIVLLKLPSIGQHCIFTRDLNVWLEKSSLKYKFLLFYFMFFFGCDYEVNIASGTKNQILQVYNFVLKNHCKLSTKLLLLCWTQLKLRHSKNVKIINLSLKTLCEIVEFKKQSVLDSLMYYVHGKQLPETHVTLLTVYNDWKLLLKNIDINQFSNSLNI